MAEHTVDRFDFDDWAGLYLENPLEFEARRSAALMIELSRRNPDHSATGRQLLEAYDKQVEGCSAEERMQLAAKMMSDSVSQLGIELKLLSQALENASHSIGQTE